MRAAAKTLLQRVLPRGFVAAAAGERRDSALFVDVEAVAHSLGAGRARRQGPAEQQVARVDRGGRAGFEQREQRGVVAGLAAKKEDVERGRRAGGLEPQYALPAPARIGDGDTAVEGRVVVSSANCFAPTRNWSATRRPSAH